MKREEINIREPQLFLYLLAGIIIFALHTATAFAINPDPLASLKSQVHTALAAAPDPTSTGFTRDDYLETIDGIVQYFRGYQQTSGDIGAIFDPYAGTEIQYSTP